MNWSKVSKRGKKVLGILSVLIAFFVFTFANAFTTPSQCKVPVAQMSHDCVKLLYP